METCPVQTDDTLRETTPHGNAEYPFSYYLDDLEKGSLSYTDWHWHHELEFMSVARGSVICLVGNDRIKLPQGYGLFVNSGVIHRFETEKHALTPNIVFSPVLLAAEGSLIYEKYVKPIMQSTISFQTFSPQIEWQQRILQMLSEVYRPQQSEDRQELRTVRLLLEIWETLFAHLEPSFRAADIRRLSHKQARLQLMMQYIHDHYTEPLTLEDIAASASISKNGALQIFQSGIHTSPVSYLIQHRLSQAADLLRTTTKPVSAIAEETGFMSAGYFCRRFKAYYQMSPNEYRKNML